MAWSDRGVWYSLIWCNNCSTTREFSEMFLKSWSHIVVWCHEAQEQNAGSLKIAITRGKRMISIFFLRTRCVWESPTRITIHGIRFRLPLRSVCVNAGAIRAYLGNPEQGGGPEDLRVVADWESFVGRHPNQFTYDPGTRKIGIRAPIGNGPSKSLEAVCADCRISLSSNDCRY